MIRYCKKIDQLVCISNFDIIIISFCIIYLFAHCKYIYLGITHPDNIG